MMTTEVAKPSDPMKEFQDKLKEKVRKDIAELLPEEAIQSLIQKAVEDEFFKERIIQQGYGSPTHKPSWFVSEVVEAARPMMREYIEKWVKSNHHLLEKALQDFVREENLLLLAVGAMSNDISANMYNTIENILTRVRSI